MEQNKHCEHVFGQNVKIQTIALTSQTSAKPPTRDGWKLVMNRGMQIHNCWKIGVKKPPWKGSPKPILKNPMGLTHGVIVQMPWHLGLGIKWHVGQPQKQNLISNWLNAETRLQIISWTQTFHLHRLSNQGAGSGRLTAQTDKQGKVRSKQAWKFRKPSHANTFL